MRGRGLFDAYMEGVVDYVNRGVPSTGDLTGEANAFCYQGYHDAQAKRVLHSWEWSREKVRTRIEVREAGLVAGS